MMPPTTLTIIVDSREKKPLTFPEHIAVLSPHHLPEQKVQIPYRIRVQTKTIETGDYVLGDDGGVLYTMPEHPLCGVVETKRSMSEVSANLFDPHRRTLFLAQLSRMRARFSKPLLVLEGGYDHLEDDQYVHPGLAIDGLQRSCMQNGVHLTTIPTNTPRQRRLCGEFVLRWLINASLSPEPNR